MFVLARAIAYAALFIGLLLTCLPARVLSRSGIVGPPAFTMQQVAGTVIGTAGAGLALWSSVAFVAIGRGTPAPFDPPRRLVIRGPYRFVRNPKYLSQPRSHGCRDFLRVVPAARLCRPLRSDRAHLRCVVRGAHIEAGVRPRLRCVLSRGETMVAMNAGGMRW